MGDDYLAQTISTESVEITSAHMALRLYLEEHAEQLLGIIQTYVIKAQMQDPEGVEVVAQEVMQGTIIEALRCVDKFDPTRPPQAWFLGFANNIIKRHRDELAQRRQHQTPISQLNIDPETTDALALFDKLAALDQHIFDALAQENPETLLEDEEIQEAQLNRLYWAWPRLPEKDREIILLRMQKNYSADEIAQALNKTPGAARVSLHRAITKLSRIMSGNGGPQL